MGEFLENLLEGVQLYHIFVILVFFFLEIGAAAIIANMIPEVPRASELAYVVVGWFAAFILCEFIEGDAEKFWGALGALEWTISSIGFVDWVAKISKGESKPPVTKRKAEQWQCPECKRMTTANQYCEFCDAKRPLSTKRGIPNEEIVLLKPGEWKCSCGRILQKYVSTCPCGKNKREQEKEQAQNEQWWVCEYCKSSNPPDDPNCVRCGATRLVQVSSAPKSCTVCGAQCDKEARFCASCGQKLS